MNTNGLVTLSPSELENVRRLLVDFAEGKVPIQQIQASLHGYFSINFDAAPGQREISVSHHLDLRDLDKVEIGVQHLHNMLQRYLDGGIRELELSDWAAFIFLSDLFVPAGETEAERQQAGEGPLWDILQRLITPGIFGGLNGDVARKYLEELLDD